MSTFTSKPFHVLEHEATLLIVDDKPSNLSVLSDYLRGFNYRILTAESGERALEIIPIAKPDIVLLDVMMPGVDGFETCRRLKADAATKNIPVIFLTALSDTIDKMKGFQLGAVDYITKPLQQEEVLARVNVHIALARLKKDLEARVIEREQLIGDLNAYAHTVAHDLKGPVGILCGMAEVLLASASNLTPEKLTDQLTKIVNAGLKLRTIIDDLLLLAVSRSDDLPLRNIHMGPIIGEVLERTSPLAEGKEIKISQPQSTEWPEVHAYSQWIEEVWVNYLTNGLKYGASEDGSYHIELGFETEGLDDINTTHVTFYIKDLGPGVPKHKQAILFSPQTNPPHGEPAKANLLSAGSDTPAVLAAKESHGLGLSIVRSIIEKLGGSVGYKSNTNTAGQPCGSTFYFTLPKAIHNA